MLGTEAFAHRARQAKCKSGALASALSSPRVLKLGAFTSAIVARMFAATRGSTNGDSNSQKDFSTTWPWPHHGRCRRRPKRHCHLLSGRFPVSIRAGLDPAADHATDDWHPDAFGPDWMGDWRRTGGKHQQDVPPMADYELGGFAGGGQHHQYCG